MRMLLLGAPGSGKGTVAQRLCRERGIPQISTGDILRDAVRRGTELGLKAKSYMNSGKLVPDEVILGMMAKRLADDDCGSGYVLDGFPRTVPQAKGLDDLTAKARTPLEAAVYIDVAEDEVIRRITSRRSCPKCGAIYNVISKPPKREGVCDADGAALVQRSDDTEAVVRNRYQVYLSETAPLVDYYRGQSKLVTVDGVGGMDEVYSKVKAGLEGRIAADP
jgi:adenylate kinase